VRMLAPVLGNGGLSVCAETRSCLPKPSHARPELQAVARRRTPRSSGGVRSECAMPRPAVIQRTGASMRTFASLSAEPGVWSLR